MNFDPNNKVVQLCAKGMSMEGDGKPQEAADLFLKAWNESISDFEKFISAHYVARHQKKPMDKLEWDEKALSFALKINDHQTKPYLPSLYLNIAKCHEDLNDIKTAKKQYQLALSFLEYLPDDGYGKMIKAGIKTGLERSSNIENVSS